MISYGADIVIYTAVALSSDLNYLASGHQDGGVRIWDVSTAAKVSLVPKVHPQHIHSLQWHPRSDKTILVSSKENPLKVIDTRTYEEVQVLKMKEFRVFSTKVGFCQSRIIFLLSLIINIS